MASDDFDIVIEAMLEAPYKKEEDEQQRKEVKKDSPNDTTTNSTSSTGSSGSGTSGNNTSGETSKKKRSRSHSRSRDRKRSRSRDRDRHRRRNSRSRSRDRQHRHRSRSWERRHSSETRSRDRRREDRVRYRSPPLAPGRRFGHSKSPHFREKSPVREPVDNLSPEERDARTVFCMQLAARIRPRDLEDFFSAVGKVRDVRIISDRNSRRSKGIAYVEFCEIQSVPLAIGLTGQRLLGVPIIVQASQAEKNRLAAMANNLQKGSGGPMRLYVGSLHFNITEDMLRGIFEPFGKIDNIVLMKDSDTGRSKGYGFITFSDSECARRALEQLNGFELAGRPMRLLLLLLLPLLLLKLHLWPQLRWLAADLAFTVRALRCKRALRARALAAAAANPERPQGGCSLAWRLAQLAQQRPAHTFLIHGARRFSYAEAERESNRTARAFLRARGWDWGPGGNDLSRDTQSIGESEQATKSTGDSVAGSGTALAECGADVMARSEGAAAPLTPGATVALLPPASPEFLWLWFGLAKAGLRTAFVPTALRRGPLLHCLRSCGARALVLAPDFLESLQPDLPALRAMGLHLWTAGPGTQPAGVSDVLAEASAEVDEPVPAYLSAPQSMMDTCLYIFTSGTTGLPKAARISHLKVLQCQGFYQLCGVRQEDVIYLALPLYHMSGSLLGIVGCLGIGATVVLKSKFSAGQFWEDCQQHGVTVFQYIGELCRYLVNQPPGKAERGHKVRLAVGSGLRPDTWERFVQRFGPLRVLETYGLTEGNVATFNYTGQRGAVGRASWLYKHVFPFSLIRYDVTTGEPIRDAQGRCLATSPGEPGLLVAPVGPQSPFLGYAGGPELAQGKLLKDVFQPGDVFFNTGDLLVCDDQGFLRFHDRTGDTFRWKGENVATTEVAEVLEALDFLQEVNVYGVSVPGHEGRAGMAALVLRPPYSLDLGQLYAHVSENLPPYAWPRFLRLQKSLATTETFKQQKVRMANEGFDPRTLSDPLYILDQATGAYLSLTPARYQALLAGDLRI
ncbi:solute carrier family 27 member 3 [Tupaia chinensis]|nr:solute carrier family 27 member 3 [Tupaia chinensis]